MTVYVFEMTTSLLQPVVYVCVSQVVGGGPKVGRGFVSRDFKMYVFLDKTLGVLFLQDTQFNWYCVVRASTPGSKTHPLQRNSKGQVFKYGAQPFPIRQAGDLPPAVFGMT